MCCPRRRSFDPTFCKNTSLLNPLPIVFHLLLCRTARICATVSPAYDYDPKVLVDYEIHDAPDIPWA